MRRNKHAKSNAQSIISVLLTGKTLRSRQIADTILEKEGKELKIQDVASMLAKISNSRRSDLGFFIQRIKVGNSFTYKMVKEVLALSEEKAYHLTLRIGKDRYTLEQALEDIPGLAKYVDASRIKPKSKGRGPAKKTEAAAKPVKAAPVPAPVPVATEKQQQQSVEESLAEIIKKVAGNIKDTGLNVTVTIKIEGPGE
jgi:hypothetical protein